MMRLPVEGHEETTHPVNCFLAHCLVTNLRPLRPTRHLQGQKRRGGVEEDGLGMGVGEEEEERDGVGEEVGTDRAVGLTDRVAEGLLVELGETVAAAAETEAEGEEEGVGMEEEEGDGEDGMSQHWNPVRPFFLSHLVTWHANPFLMAARHLWKAFLLLLSATMHRHPQSDGRLPEAAIRHKARARRKSVLFIIVMVMWNGS